MIINHNLINDQPVTRELQLCLGQIQGILRKCTAEKLRISCPMWLAGQVFAPEPNLPGWFIHGSENDPINKPISGSIIKTRVVQQFNQGCCVLLPCQTNLSSLTMFNQPLDANDAYVGGCSAQLKAGKSWSNTNTQGLVSTSLGFLVHDFGCFTALGTKPISDPFKLDMKRLQLPIPKLLIGHRKFHLPLNQFA